MAEFDFVKTSELIAVLAADPVSPPVHMGRRVAMALAMGILVSLGVYLVFVGPRPDIAAAVQTVRFNLKFLDALALPAPSLLLMLRLARPDARPGTLLLWLLAPLFLLAVAVVVELMVAPSSEWLPRLVGHTPLYCMTMITMLAVAPLAGLIAAMRAGAPQYPGLTGAFAGAASAGVAALLFVPHCPDDSPLFVATWYPLATLICMGVGALVGRRFLAW